MSIVSRTVYMMFYCNSTYLLYRSNPNHNCNLIHNTNLDLNPDLNH